VLETGGEKLSYKSARSEAGLTLKEAADAIGVTAQAVSLWENGKSNPTADNIVKMSEVYGCTTDKLLKGE
jgi:transcriptional regulator with XRE-family HTH domain